MLADTTYCTKFKLFFFFLIDLHFNFNIKEQ